MKRRIINAEEIQERFSSGEIQELRKQNYGVPYEILELETDKWIARFYHTDLIDNGGNQIVDIIDRDTKFCITDWLSSIAEVYPLCNILPGSYSASYKKIKEVDGDILERTVNEVLNRLKEPKLKRNKGLPLREIVQHGAGIIIGKEQDRISV